MTAIVNGLPKARNVAAELVPPASVGPREDFDRSFDDAEARLDRLKEPESRPDRAAPHGEGKTSDTESAESVESRQGTKASIDAQDAPTTDASAPNPQPRGGEVDPRPTPPQQAPASPAPSFGGGAPVSLDAEQATIATIAAAQGDSGTTPANPSATPLQTSAVPTVDTTATVVAVASVADTDATNMQGAGPRAGGAVPLPPGLVPEEEVNMGRVVRGIRTAINQQGGAVTLRLHPPELGCVRIQLEIQNGVVRAEFSAEHASVRNLLTQQMGQLRAALESHGLNVERLVAQTLNSNASGNSTQSGTDAAPDDGRSRGWRFAQSDAGQRNDDDEEMVAEDGAAGFEVALNTVG